MDLFKESYYKLNFIFLSLVGQWPYQNSKTRSLSRFLFSIMYISSMQTQLFRKDGFASVQHISSFVIARINVESVITLHLMNQAMKLFTSQYDINLIVEILPFFFACMILATKYYTCWIQNEILKHILERIRYDWTVLKTKNEHNILRRYTELGSTYGLFYTIAIYTGVSIFLTIPFTPSIMNIFMSTNMSLAHYHPIKAEYFLDEEKYFYSILVHMDLTVILSLTTLIACDVLFITILMHASGTLNVLGHRLEHLFDDVNEENNNVDTVYISRVRICECIEYHSAIYEYVETVKSCYSVSSIMQLALAVCIITSILLHMFQNLLRKNYGEACASFIHTVGHSFAVFMNVLPAQKLIDHSSDIYYKTYFGLWYRAPVETQKLLLLIMQRSQEPFTLTAAGVLTSSFEMYASMLETSVSFFTVFYSIK